MSRIDDVVAFPAYYRSAPCSSRFTPGFVAFRLRSRDTPRFNRGTIDLTSVQYLICNAAAGEIEFSIVQAKDLFVGMSASRRMENRHVVLHAGGNLWRDIGDLKSWSDEVDRAGMSGEMADSLARIVIAPSADGSPPSVEVTRAFDAAAFAAVDSAVPFSIVPPSPSFCAATIGPKKYAGAKFSPEAIGMAPVTTEQREKLLSSRKRGSNEDRAHDRRPAKRQELDEEQPSPLDVSLEELRGPAGQQPDPRPPVAPAMDLEELLALDEDDSPLPPLPEIPRNAAVHTSLQDDLDFIFGELSA